MGIFDAFAGIAMPLVRSECPSCSATWRHVKGCELAKLSIETAAVLGSEEARKRVAHLKPKD